MQPSWGVSAVSESHTEVMVQPQAGAQAQPVQMNDQAVSDPPRGAGVPLGLQARHAEVWATEQGWVEENGSSGGKQSHLVGSTATKVLWRLLLAPGHIYLVKNYHPSQSTGTNCQALNFSLVMFNPSAGLFSCMCSQKGQ